MVMILSVETLPALFFTFYLLQREFISEYLEPWLSLKKGLTIPP